MNKTEALKALEGLSNRKVAKLSKRQVTDKTVARFRRGERVHVSTEVAILAAAKALCDAPATAD